MRLFGKKSKSDRYVKPNDLIRCWQLSDDNYYLYKLPDWIRDLIKNKSLKIYLKDNHITVALLETTVLSVQPIHQGDWIVYDKYLNLIACMTNSEFKERYVNVKLLSKKGD